MNETEIFELRKLQKIIFGDHKCSTCGKEYFFECCCERQPTRHREGFTDAQLNYIAQIISRCVNSKKGVVPDCVYKILPDIIFDN